MWIHFNTLLISRINLPPDRILEPRKTAISRHLEKGRSPDEAIQKLAVLLDYHVLYRIGIYTS